MKHFVIWLLISALALCLLTGCNQTEPEVTTTAQTEQTDATVPQATLPPETTASTEPSETQPPTFPMGTMGSRTDGTLRSLALDIGTYCYTFPLGENVLLCAPQEGRYQVRSLADGSILAEVTDTNLANAVTVTNDRILYYSLGSRKIIVRDFDLNLVKTIDPAVPDKVYNASSIYFSQDGSKAYFCTDQYTVAEMHIETGEMRTIPVYGAPIWSVTGLYFEDTIMAYWGKENSEDYYAFLNLETGAYLGKDTSLSRFRQWDSGYYLCRSQMGNVEHRIVQDGVTMYMTPKDHGYGTKFFDAWVLPELNSFLTLHYNYEGSVVKLDLYDLDTQKRTASLTVVLELASTTTVFADTSGEYIWLSAKTGAQMTLCRWDFKANAVEDTTVYGYSR